MEHNHSAELVSFKKAKSHIAKIITMIENDEYCIDVMQQNLAVMGLLKSAQQHMMEGHLNVCFKQAMDTGSPKQKQDMIKEILTVTKFNNNK